MTSQIRGALAIAGVAALFTTMNAASAGAAAPRALDGSPAGSPAAVRVSTATADTHDRLITAAGPTNVYNPAFADVHTVVSALSVGGRTIVVLVVTGLPKAYWTKTMGAHVHIKACGADPAAAGGHYANPAAGRTVKPADKEIWLDFKAHKAGWAISTATVDWLIEPGAARSVVIHALPTDAAGNAGARVVCSTVPFGFAGRTRPPSIS